MANQTLITDLCAILDSSNQLHTQPACIHINGQTISKVESCNSSQFESKLKFWKERYPKALVLKNKLVTPALINNHTHLAMSFFRGLTYKLQKMPENMVEQFFFQAEKKISYEDIKAFTRMGAYEALLSGTGYVWDHYYQPLACAEALSETGLQGSVAGTLQDIYGPGIQLSDKFLHQTLELQEDSGFKSAGIDATLGPHASDSVSEKLWQEIINLSKKYHLPIHFHLAQSQDEIKRHQKRNHQSPVEWLKKIGLFSSNLKIRAAHGIYLSTNDMQILKGKLTLIHCPYSAMIFAQPADFRDWDKIGIEWNIGTDCVASNDSMNVQKDLRLLHGWNNISKTLSSSEQQEPYMSRQLCLEKITTQGSHHIPGHPSGAIKAGFRANLAIWNTKHPSIWPAKEWTASVFSDANSSLEWMLVGGKKIGEPGQLLGSTLLNSNQYQKHLEEAEDRFYKLLERLG